MYLKAWAVFTRKGFGDTEVLWNIVYRSQILVLHFLSLSFHVTLFTEPFAQGQICPNSNGVYHMFLFY